MEPARRTFESFNEFQAFVRSGSGYVRSPDNSDRDAECPICAVEYDDLWTEPRRPGHEIPLQLPCGHIFGHLCIERWVSASINSSKTCPVCRAVIVETPRYQSDSDYSSDSMLDPSNPRPHSLDGRDLFEDVYNTHTMEGSTFGSLGANSLQSRGQDENQAATRTQIVGYPWTASEWITNPLRVGYGRRLSIDLGTIIERAGTRQTDAPLFSPRNWNHRPTLGHPLAPYTVNCTLLVHFLQVVFLEVSETASAMEYMHSTVLAMTPAQHVLNMMVMRVRGFAERMTTRVEMVRYLLDGLISQELFTRAARFRELRILLEFSAHLAIRAVVLSDAVVCNCVRCGRDTSRHQRRTVVGSMAATPLFLCEICLFVPAYVHSEGSAASWRLACLLCYGHSLRWCVTCFGL